MFKSFKAVIIICCMIFFITFLTVVLGLFYNGWIWFNNPGKQAYPVRGIDVSHHQGEINWEEVAAQNFHFVFIKATEGDDFKDHRFQYNYQSARSYGLITGGYHFYSLRIPGAKQAHNFIDSVPAAADDLPPVVDLEFGGNSKVRPSREDFINELEEYIRIIRNHYGKDPILYITYEFYEAYLTGWTTTCPLWIRDIFNKPHLPRNLRWHFWQYSSRGHVEGIEGFVDLNVFNGAKSDLITLIGTDFSLIRTEEGR